MPAVKIKVGDNKYLVAETCADPDYKEIYVFLEIDGCVYQDLAIIGQQFDYDDEKTVMKDGKYYVTVYGDPDDEDYTKKYLIDEHKEEE